MMLEVKVVRVRCCWQFKGAAEPRGLCHSDDDQPGMTVGTCSRLLVAWIDLLPPRMHVADAAAMDENIIVSGIDQNQGTGITAQEWVSKGKNHG